MIRVITLEREYGSGGADIARKIADRQGWKLWDQLLTNEIARRMGIDQTTVAHHLALLNLPPELDEAFKSGRCTSPRTLYELRIPVLDREGVIAEVATLAARFGVNISDLEIAHSIEGRSGVLVLVVAATGLDAFEESRTPRPSLKLSAGEDLAGREVWLRVRDNGPGIPPETLARIFNPFYTSKASGTGLGLAISKKLVDAHGGSIDVSSTPGQGSEFVLTLPKRAGAGRAFGS